MIRILLVILTGIVTSLFLFPFNLTFAAGVNTKMVIAAVGLVLFILDMVWKKSFSISKDFLIFSIVCFLVSIWCFFVITLNNTSDSTFTQYFISAWVWMGGAYTVVKLIRAVHGKISVKLIGHYLIGVCVAQCILAYLMTIFPPVKLFVDGLLGSGERFMGPVASRMYGLGAALDPSGIRFAGVLVILAHLMHQTVDTRDKTVEAFYIVAYIIILVLGNMISRSTTIGVIISVFYWVYLSLFDTKKLFSSSFGATASLCILLSIGLIIFLYQTDSSFRENLRFGFEGFFSLAETGHWETNSTDILQSMVRWPESLRTWIIGDGYFANPQDIPDIFGQVTLGYYKNTDIGYLRYIYYFGTIGLLGMIAVFVSITATCFRVLIKDRYLFLFLLLVNLTGWIKVASDIIMVFAPFFVLACLLKKEQVE